AFTRFCLASSASVLLHDCVTSALTSPCDISQDLRGDSCSQAKHCMTFKGYSNPVADTHFPDVPLSIEQTLLIGRDKTELFTTEHD
ncbi:hypothetical protein GOODEAATRI_007539, partial [Goodea atripinnis]